MECCHSKQDFCIKKLKFDLIRVCINTRRLKVVILSFLQFSTWIIELWADSSEMWPNPQKCGRFLRHVADRWVSVVEFHDRALCIGNVFGQESTVVKWNYQILGLHQVHQKLGVILVTKWYKNWSQQKMLFTKKVRLNWYSSMNFFLERFGWFLT